MRGSRAAHGPPPRPAGMALRAVRALAEALVSRAAQRATGIPARGNSPGTRASKPAGRRAGAWAAPCAPHPLRTKSPRSGEMPSREHGPRERGLPSPPANGHAHAPRRTPRTRFGLQVRAPGNAQPRQCATGIPARGNSPGTRASKPACLRGSHWQVPAHARFAALHFVAERLRVPTGGAAGCGPRSRSAREAAPLQKGTRPSAWTSARKVPRASLPVGIPRDRGLPSPQANGHAHAPRHAPRTHCGLQVRAPEKCPAASTAPGSAGFQARRPMGRRMGRALRPASAAD